MTKKPRAARQQGDSGEATEAMFRRGVLPTLGVSAYIPVNAGIYVRISDDPFGLERGVNRQTDDCMQRANSLGWTIGKVYTENDTSAYRKKKTTLPDGTVAWRVVRPEFRAMLDDLYHGRIDGIIVYDQDRLLRQPRDLEDLIDIVEAVRRPVTGITGAINLLTSDGRAMARVMAAMALKSSEDTARRVARAQMEDAMNGTVRKLRRFGWTMDGEIIDEEAQAARTAAAQVIASGSWRQATIALEDGDVRPVAGGHWHMATVRNMLLSPTIAGISVYRGAMRERDARRDGRPNLADPTADAIKDARGDYIMTDLEPVLDIATWEALCTMVKDAHEGKAPALPHAKKYLLSGLLKCANVREDGTVCGRGMNATITRRKEYPNQEKVVYRCPGHAYGGCGKISRSARPVDELIEELLFRHLKAKAPRRPAAAPVLIAESKTARRLSDLRVRLADMRQRYAEGDPDLTAETFYSSVPIMEAQIKKFSAEVADEQAARAPRLTADEVAAEWKAVDTAGKRAILARYLIAIEVRPSTTRGPGTFDHNAITPIWKEAPKR